MKTYQELKQMRDQALRDSFEVEKRYLAEVALVGKANVSDEIWNEYLSANDKVDQIKTELDKVRRLNK